jgi:putative ABC transport system permease protein
MNFINIFRIAILALLKNKTRSLLTMLGVIIGVASVIAMLAIGQGSNESIQKQIQTLGTNVVMVMPAAMTQGGVKQDAGTSQALTMLDVDAIKRSCPSVAMASPVVRKGAQLIASAKNARSTVYGVNEEYLQIKNQGVETGQNFSDQDYHGVKKICLLGKTVVTNLFGEYANPVGQTIRIENVPFRIVGVLEAKGQSMMGQDQDDVVIAPFACVQKRLLSIDYIHTIYTSAVSKELVPAASEEISRALRSRRKLSPEADAPFDIRTQEEIAKIFSSITGIMMVLLSSIAAISLLVGGIGIMNIMLVSVTERTREIGLRMAIGAKGMDILSQFLVESILLSAFGGFIGVCLGSGIAVLVRVLAGWPTTVSIGSIILSFSFATFVGIFFGWYPARKASQLNPIDALRYE